MFAHIFLRKNILFKVGTRFKPFTSQWNLYCSSKQRTEGLEMTEVDRSFLDKFKIFHNTDSGIVYDIEEEKSMLKKDGPSPMENFDKREYPKLFCDAVLSETSKSASVDIERLVEILKNENACNICVIKLPSKLKYVDYLCIINGKSYRHMIGIAEYVRRTLKSEKSLTSIPKIEGKDCRDWIAMDLGTVALHIFNEKARKVYDLETLWCLGPEYEKFLRDLKPIENEPPPITDSCAIKSENI